MRSLSSIATALACVSLIFGIILARHEGDNILVIENQHHATPTRASAVPKTGPLAPADSGRAPYSGSIPQGPNAHALKVGLTLPQPKAGGWYISAFYSRDTRINIAPLINAAGDEYNVWPVYLLAVVLAESGGYQYAWHDWGWPDISGGFTQQTVQTLATYGVCNNDIACAKGWEWNATNSIYMGARILNDYRRITGIGYLGLWQCYNAGVGSCQSPYYSAFLQNYYIAATYATSTNPTPPPPPPTPRPTPTPFPQKSWGTLPHLQNGKLTWAASNYHKRFGHYQGERFIQGRHRGGAYMKYAFRHADLYCHFNSGRCNATTR